MLLVHQQVNTTTMDELVVSEDAPQDSHLQNYVGILAMGGFVNVGGQTLLVTALMTGSFHHIKEHENLFKRLVVFAGGPLCDIDNQYTKLGTKLKERGVAVDVVNFGVQQAG